MSTIPASRSPLDFGNGDELTLECWIRMEGPPAGSYPYLISKGRTHREGMGIRNQNYSLRLATGGGGPFISFFFCDSETETEGSDIKDEGHRWTSSTAVPMDGGWHHVAITYHFGEPDQFKGYIDGRAVDGKWDMGGPTTLEPVQDDDQLWIGSAMQGRSSFTGNIDEVAIYRRALTPEEIASHYHVNLAEAEYAVGKIREDEVPDDRVRVEIMEQVPVQRSWNFRMQQPEHVIDLDVFALNEIPRTYNDRGLIEERTIPMLVHMTSRVEFEAGRYEFLLRSLDSARLYVDGELVGETEFMSLSGDAHHELYDITETPLDLLSIPAAHEEAKAVLDLSEGPHVISVYRLLGNPGHGQYLGEISLGVSPVAAETSEATGPAMFVAPVRQLPFTDAGWLQFVQEERLLRRRVEQQQRLAVSEGESAYWEQRHQYAREHAPPAVEVPTLEDASAANNEIDAFINDQLHAAGLRPLPLTPDDAFLRRLSLDVVGRIPTLEEIDLFFADPPNERRRLAIDRYLASDEWADHWVGYWQDVLAENPGLTKPELNNTGPFRWFLYEAFVDNRPLDQWVSQLISLEGSAEFGGPAGFGMATQNDVPMAAKAHVLGTAFLGVQMRCARCHDAPYHDILQQDLFAVGAMLGRGPITIPGSSSVAVGPGGRVPLVQVSLTPGSAVAPEWPFAALLDENSLDLPDWMVRHPGDTREELALCITHPANARFAGVIVNRLWQRYMGRGIASSADDWELAEISHPELLDWLTRELIVSGYDLKHVARLILASHTYQRLPVADQGAESREESALFAGPDRRRMSAEQLVDSLFTAAGKLFESEELTMDADGKQPEDRFLHMGHPTRAWEFVAVSNERDRPALGLPVAQSVIDLLQAYGWRQQRQDPLTERDDALTALQPMSLAFGTMSASLIDVSDDGALIDLATREQSVGELVDQLYLRFLTRLPSSEERLAYVELLSEGYEDRVVAGPDDVPPRRIHRSPLTWRNHLNDRANTYAIERERDVEAGDTPSMQLAPDWRLPPRRLSLGADEHARVHLRTVIVTNERHPSMGGVFVARRGPPKHRTAWFCQRERGSRSSGGTLKTGTLLRPGAFRADCLNCGDWLLSIEPESSIIDPFSVTISLAVCYVERDRICPARNSQVSAPCRVCRESPH